MFIAAQLAGWCQSGLCPHIHLFIRLPCMAKTLTLSITLKLANQCFSCQPCTWVPLTSVILYEIQWPWPWLRVSRSAQKKPVGNIFSHTFQLIKMKFDMVLKEKYNFWVRCIYSTTVVLTATEKTERFSSIWMFRDQFYLRWDLMINIVNSTVLKQS